MKKNNFWLKLASYFTGSVIFLGTAALSAPVKAQQTAIVTDFGTVNNLGEYLTMFFAWAIPITGGIAVIMFTYAGYLYMTSQGNQENINTAKDIIIGVILGLLLLFGAQILLRDVIGTI